MSDAIEPAAHRVPSDPRLARTPRRIALGLLVLLALPLSLLLALSIEALRGRQARSEAALGRSAQANLTGLEQRLSQGVAQLLRAQVDHPASDAVHEVAASGQRLLRPRTGYWRGPAAPPLPPWLRRRLDAARQRPAADQVSALDALLAQPRTEHQRRQLALQRAVALLAADRPGEAHAALVALAGEVGPHRDDAGMPLLAYVTLALVRAETALGDPFRAARRLVELERHLAGRAWGVEPALRRALQGEVDRRLTPLVRQLGPDDTRYVAERRARAAALAGRVAWVQGELERGLVSGPDWRATTDGERLVYHRRTPRGSLLLVRLPPAQVRAHLRPELEAAGAAEQARFSLAAEDAPADASYRSRPAGLLLPGMRLGVRPWALEAERATARQQTGWAAAMLGFALIVLAGGLVLGYRVVTREIAAARAREAFVASVSHELRTPLTSIRIFAESLADGGVPEAKVRQYAARIDREARRLGRLIDGVLDLAALERGQVRLQPAALSVASVVEQTRSLFAHRTSHARCRLAVQIGDGLGVRADPDALIQVLLALLDNAAKFSPDGGRVRLVADGQDDRVVFAVSDEGPGIRPDERRRVFERFYRGRAGNETPGLGLGLSIAMALTRAMDGDLVADASEAGGARLRLRLPAATLPVEVVTT